MNQIKAIVFDFGNVIINIDLELTFQAFSKITGKSIDKVKSLFNEFKVFQRYETGEFSDDDFRDLLRSIFNQPLTDTEIDMAWNALILDIPKERITLLNDLSRIYPIYLLSNTNHIHIEFSNRYLSQNFGIKHLSNLFDDIFLSYELEMWKPDEEIYKHVSQKLKLNPNQILFLDDNQENIQSSKAFGFESVLIDPGNFTILNYFKDKI